MSHVALVHSNKIPLVQHLNLKQKRTRVTYFSRKVYEGSTCGVCVCGGGPLVRTWRFLNACDLHSLLNIFLSVHVLFDFPTRSILSTPPDPCLFRTRTSLALWFFVKLDGRLIVEFLERELGVGATVPRPQSKSSLFNTQAVSSSSSVSSFMLWPRVTPICGQTEKDHCCFT